MLKRIGLMWSMSFFIVVACAKTPITGKQVFIVTSESQEAELGLKAYEEILQKSQISNNRARTDVLNRVASRIAAVANKPEYKWEFKLIESKEKNAFCLPGGKIAVYTGIFDLFTNEAELAAVVGHEVAHATARHAGQRITFQFGTEIGFAALSELMGTDTLEKKILIQALGLGTTVGAVLPFSRSQEGEADFIGEVYMAMAGYDPSASITLWQAFAKNPTKAPEFLSTHPAPEKRIVALTEHLPEAQGYYQQAPNKYGLGERLSVAASRYAFEALSQSEL
jgi:metalloendopeptidase OMA1, mitochondrial